jgi:hypothetical protein
MLDELNIHYFFIRSLSYKFAEVIACAAIVISVKSEASACGGVP